MEGIFGTFFLNQMLATLVKELDALSNTAPFNRSASNSKGVGWLIRLSGERQWKTFIPDSQNCSLLIDNEFDYTHVY